MHDKHRGSGSHQLIDSLSREKRQLGFLQSSPKIKKKKASKALNQIHTLRTIKTSSQHYSKIKSGMICISKSPTFLSFFLIKETIP